MKNAYFNFTCVGLLVSVGLVACGKDKFSHETTESSRAVASENSVFNAQKWRADLYPTWAIIPRGDSTQTRECPQGDGWASLDLVSPEKDKTIGLKCSTYSAGIGCMTSSDFKSRSALSSQENKCNAEVPFPLPKVAL